MEINDHQVVWVVVHRKLDNDFAESYEEDFGHKPGASLELTDYSVATYSTRPAAVKDAKVLIAEGKNFEEWHDNDNVFWTRSDYDGGTVESVEILKQVVL